jgi:membrane-associated phospholipid phosphatase|tara:strand:+ start:1298 stop:1810 length:513 start_codon:yes stop_codon:yes gene_type:complete
MFIKLNSVYDYISVFAVLVNIYIIYSLDVVLMTGLAASVFFHDFIKEITTGWYAPIFKRPNGAINCSLFNSGGLVDHKSGFPSGHVTAVSFLMNVWLFRNGNKNDWKTYIIYNIPIALMACARIMKGCHNFIQVVAGYLLGYGIATIVFMYEDKIKDFFRKLRNSFNHYL